jgi:hypothetical protein
MRVAGGVLDPEGVSVQLCRVVDFETRRHRPAGLAEVVVRAWGHAVGGDGVGDVEDPCDRFSLSAQGSGLLPSGRPRPR